MGFILECGCNCIDEQTIIPCFSENCIYDDKVIKERFEKEKEMDNQTKEFEKDMMNEINPWIN